MAANTAPAHADTAHPASQAPTRSGAGLVIGFVGHRSLDNPRIVHGEIVRHLIHMKESESASISAVSSIAIGGDTLFARAALAAKIPLRVQLPFSEDEFRKDFSEQDWSRAEAIIRQAASVERGPLSEGARRDEDYAACGRRIVEACDVLLAVWDGRPARGHGGTQESIDYAKSLGKRVIVIHAEQASPQRDAAVVKSGFFNFSNFSMKKIHFFAQNILLPIAAALTLILGFCGYWKYRQDFGITDRFMGTVRLFAATFDYAKYTPPALPPHIPLSLTIARWLALFSTFIAVVKTYGLIAADHTLRLKLMRTRGHTVICGLGERGYHIAMNLLRQKKTVVIIDADANNPRLADVRESGALIIIGDSTSESMLRMARIQTAAAVHITLGDDNKAMAVAIECRRIVCGDSGKKDTSWATASWRKAKAAQAAFYRWRTGKEAAKKHLVCDAHLQRPHSTKLFKDHGLFNECSNKDLFEPIIIDDNLQATWQLLLDHGGKMIAPARTLDKPPHIVLIGAGWIGQNLLLRMAHILHTGSDPRNPKPLDITVVDIRADERRHELASQYPFLCAHHDAGPFIEPAFITANIAHCDHELMEKICDGKPIAGVFICIGNETEGLAAALPLRRWLDDPHVTGRKVPGGQAPIVVCTNTGAGLVKLFKDEAVRNFNARNIYIHNLTRSACERFGASGDAVEKVAQILHDDYCRRERENERKSLEENPQYKPTPNENLVEWSELSEHFKESNRGQASNLLLSLACLGYTFRLRTPDDPPPPKASEGSPKALPCSKDEVTLLGHMEHRRWMIEKYLDGWKYGPKKDLRLKQNPDLIAWGELDGPTQDKDTKPLEERLPLLNEIYIIRRE